jgi:prepilin-type N-terminal cleavage/methylation domain-containing protein
MTPSRGDLVLFQYLTGEFRQWCTSCSVGGMRSTRGFTLFELLIVMALIATASAMAIPTIMGSVERNSVWTASETIGAQIRQARLKAISRNRTFRVRFDCPNVGQLRWSMATMIDVP